MNNDTNSSACGLVCIWLLTNVYFVHPLQIVLFTEMFINQASTNTFGGVFAQYNFSRSQLGKVPTVCCDWLRSSQTDTATLVFGLLFAVLFSVLLWPKLSTQCPGTSRQKLHVFEPGSRWHDQGEKVPFFQWGLYHWQCGCCGVCGCRCYQFHVSAVSDCF